MIEPLHEFESRINLWLDICKALSKKKRGLLMLIGTTRIAGVDQPKVYIESQSSFITGLLRESETFTFVQEELSRRLGFPCEIEIVREITDEQLEYIWVRVLSDLKPYGLIFRSLLMNACNVRIDDGKIVLPVRSKYLEEIVFEPAVYNLLVETFQKHLKTPYRLVAETIANESLDVTSLDEPTANPLNNAKLATTEIILHDGIAFRSPPEVAIYDALKVRGVLVLVNSTATLGGDNPSKREPDFLVCQDGKWGILEVMGQTYHTNAMRDHERGRLFKRYGLMCIEFYDAMRSLREPQKVVDEFLSILAKS